MAVASDTMTDMADGHIRVGRIVSESFGVLFRNIAPFGLLALLAMAPLAIIEFMAGTNETTTEMTVANASVAVVSLIGFLILSFVLTGAITYGTYEDLRAGRPSIGRCLGVGLSRAFPILLVAIVMGFAMILGTLALIIPGIIIWLMFYVAIPVAVVERPGVFASLGRSRQLTRGNRWRLFGLALLYALISGVIQVVLGLVIVGLALSGGEPSPFAVAVNWISQAVGALLYSTFAAVTYFALREAKEGLDVNQLAAVFD